MAAIRFSTDLKEGSRREEYNLKSLSDLNQRHYSINIFLPQKDRSGSTSFYLLPLLQMQENKANQFQGFCLTDLMAVAVSPKSKPSTKIRT